MVYGTTTTPLGGTPPPPSPLSPKLQGVLAAVIIVVIVIAFCAYAAYRIWTAGCPCRSARKRHSPTSNPAPRSSASSHNLELDQVWEGGASHYSGERDESEESDASTLVEAEEERDLPRLGVRVQEGSALSTCSESSETEGSSGRGFSMESVAFGGEEGAGEVATEPIN